MLIAFTHSPLRALRAKVHFFSELLIYFLISSFFTFYLLPIALNALNALKPINTGFSQGTFYKITCPKLAPDSPDLMLP